MYEIHTKDFYQDISLDVEELFDTSNYSEDHPSGIPTGLNKKVIGMFKDKAGGKQIRKFVGLRSKLYPGNCTPLKCTIKADKEKKKCKGVKKCVVKKKITFDVTGSITYKR